VSLTFPFRKASLFFGAFAAASQPLCSSVIFSHSPGQALGCLVDSTENVPSVSQRRESLKKELTRVRKASLLASENGDYRKIAQLTLEAARLNQALAGDETPSDSP
jgi:hypothetical protein